MPESDLRFVSNAAFGAALVTLLIGVAFASYMEESRTYLIASFAIISGLMFGIGSATRYHAHKEEKRWTIKRDWDDA